jgi:hypothetical protein
MARLAQCKQAGQVQPGVKMYKKGGKVCADNEGQEKTELKEAKALQTKAKMGKKSGGLMKGCK